MRWLWSDEATMAPVGGPVLLTDEIAERWFRRMVDPGNPLDGYYLIVDAQDRPVGEVSWHRLDPYTMTAALNLKVAHAERRQGYGSDALVQLLHEFFCRRGGKLMIDDVAVDNLGGQQMLLRFGFEADHGSVGTFRLLMREDRFRHRYGCPDMSTSQADDRGGRPRADSPRR